MVKQQKMAPQGPMFSEVVQGYWRMGDWGMTAQESLRFLKQHIELGVTTVDHAHVYGNAPSCEELFGRVLALEPGVRDQIQVVSKCGIELTDQADLVNHYDSTPEAINASVDTSLSRLGVEQLDVLLIHRPDWLMDADIIADTFRSLKQAGKVAHFGVSNFTASQFALLQSRLDAPLVTNQIEINPLNLPILDGGILELLQQQRVLPMAWSCLGGGRFFTESTPQMERLRLCLEKIAGEIGAQSIDEVLYAWVRKLPSQPVLLVGSGKIERVRTAISALDLKLSQEQWYRIWVAAQGHGVP